MQFIVALFNKVSPSRHNIIKHLSSNLDKFNEYYDSYEPNNYHDQYIMAKTEKVNKQKAVSYEMSKYNISC